MPKIIERPTSPGEGHRLDVSAAISEIDLDAGTVRFVGSGRGRKVGKRVPIGRVDTSIIRSGSATRARGVIIRWSIVSLVVIAAAVTYIVGGIDRAPGPEPTAVVVDIGTPMSIVRPPAGD